MSTVNWSGWWLLIITFVLITIGCREQLTTSPRSLQVETVVSLVGQHRIIEARLTGGFGYGPMVSALTDNANPSSVLQSQTDSYQLTELQKLPGEPHAIAILNILTGQPDRAINILEPITQQSSEQVALINDLAVAYYYRGIQRKNLADLIHALSLIDSAVEKAPQLLESHFNRALILKNVGLLSTAATAWAEYRRLETTPEWQREAEQQIAQINEKLKMPDWSQARKEFDAAAINGDYQKAATIIRSFPHQARIYALDQLLPGWAKQCHQSCDSAAQTLASARLIGECLVNFQHDYQVLDTVIAAENAYKQPIKSSHLTDLIFAYQTYQQALELQSKGYVKLAAQQFIKAHHLFQENGDIANASLSLFYSLHWDSDHGKSIVKLNNLIAVAKQKNYLYLQGRAWRGVGTLLGLSFKPSAALNAQKTALSLLIDAGDLAGVTMIHLIITEILDQIGEKEEVWQFRQKVLTDLQNITNIGDRVRVLSGLATQLGNSRELRAANYFHDESVKTAAMIESPLYLPFALLRRSLNNYQLGKAERMQSDIAQVKQLIVTMPDSELRNLYQIEETIVESNILKKDDPGKTINLLSKLIIRYSRSSSKYYTTYIYKTLAEAYLAQGEIKKAEENFKIGISEYEKQREYINNARQRVDFLNNAQTAYQDMIALLISNNRMTEAFDYCDRAKARVLLDVMQQARHLTADISEHHLIIEGSAQPLKLNSFQKQLSTQVTLIEYFIQGNELMAWIVEHDSLKLIKLPVSVDQIEPLIKTMESLIQQQEQTQDFINLSAKLYDSLYRPLKQYLPANQRLIIIPDLLLYRLPFSILFNATSRQYLIEEHAIGYAPSASIYWYSQQLDSQLASNLKTSLLIVGNPKFDKKRYPQLEDLPAANLEASEIKNLYQNAQRRNNLFRLEWLFGETATRQAFVDAIADHSIIHFAGHALENQTFPLESQLIFAGEPNTDKNLLNDSIYAYELYHAHLKKTRLVVLAACRTADGQLKAGEGLLSIARAFLAARVPAVVANLWDANDSAIAPLSIAFHRQLLEGKDTMLALQAAQIEMIKCKDNRLNNPRSWGGFILMGNNINLVKYP